MVTNKQQDSEPDYGLVSSPGKHPNKEENYALMAMWTIKGCTFPSLIARTRGKGRIVIVMGIELVTLFGKP